MAGETMLRRPSRVPTKRSLVTLPVDLADEIERYRQDHYINSTSDAIRSLVVAALRHVVAVRPAAAPEKKPAP